MRIAAYNVENLFQRPKAFNEDSSISNKTVKAVAELNSLFEEETYSKAKKNRMIALLKDLGLSKSDKSKFAILRKIRGKIVKRPRNGPMEIVPDGRNDWVGWAELTKSSVNEIAVMNTGRVIRDVDADILAVVEADSRLTLKMFSDQILEEVNGKPYANVMLIDGNDLRGIDVGIMTRKKYPIESMRSHIYDTNSRGRTIFSRDCPEYCVETPNGEKVWILPNHFKSKYGGNNSDSQNRRRAQAKRTAQIYNELIAEGNENVVVLGDLNDTPDSTPLRPLLVNTDLVDVSEHPSFDTGEFPGKGTYGLGNDSNKIDYLLLSPALFDRVTESGLFRKGAWPGKRPKRWTVYPELVKEIHVGSDHHVIWCEIQ